MFTGLHILLGLTYSVQANIQISRFNLFPEENVLTMDTHGLISRRDSTR